MRYDPLTTTITDGILQIENNGSLGAATGDTVVSSGGTLALAGRIKPKQPNRLTTPLGEFIDIAGSGEGGIGAISNTSGSNFWTGDVDLTGDATIGAQAGTLTFTNDDNVDLNSFDLTLKPGSGASLVFEGVIFDAPDSSNLFKEGQGLAVFRASNTYDALTTVREGTLQIENDTALGDTGAGKGTVVNSGATLALSGGINTPDAELLTLSGNGDTGKAALWSESGINEWDGAITLSGTNASFGANAGSTLTVDGIISGTQSVIIEGSGVVEWADPMAYTGATNITSGTLRYAQGANRISDSSAVTVAAGATYDLNNLNDTIGSLAGAGNVTLGTATLTTGVDNTSTAFSGVMSETGNLVKEGNGTFTLSNNNTYTGATTVNNGTLLISNGGALGTTAGNTIVNSGGTLALSGGIAIATGEDITLSGTGESNAGAIQNISGSNIINGDIGLGADATINSDAGTLTHSASAALTLNINVLTVGGAGNTVLDSRITDGGPGTSDIIKTGSGTLTISDPTNIYSGDTTVRAGTLIVAANSPQGAAGALGDGPPNPVALGDSSTVSTDDISLLINTAGVDVGRNINVNDFGNTLTIGGSHTSGTSTFSGDISLSKDATLTSASGGTVVYSASAVLTLNTNVLTVVGAGNTVLDSFISDGGAGTSDIIKTGSGTLTISDPTNIYSGDTTVRAGTLIVAANSPQGAAGALGDGPNPVALGDSSTVSTDDISLLINTAGVDVGRNINLNNFGNTITIGGTHTSGTSTFSGNISLSKDVTLTSASGGTVDFTGVLSETVASDVTKVGGGTVVLKGTNTYTGTTTINSGTLELNNISGNAINNSSQINITGGTLLLSANNQIADATNMNLNGGTFSTAGFDESLASLTLSSTSTIDVGAGGSIINYTSGTHSAGQLNVTSWAGSFGGGGSDQIIFGSSLTQTFLDNVVWTDQGITGAFQLPSGEIVPIPEPATIFSGALLVGLIGIDFYRRRKMSKSSEPIDPGIQH